MSEKFCERCQAVAKADGSNRPICQADAFLNTQTDYVKESSGWVQSYPEWLGSFIRFLARLRLDHFDCPNKKFKRHLYSAESALGKTKS